MTEAIPLALPLTGNTLKPMSMIDVIMFFGLVTKKAFLGGGFGVPVAGD